MALEGREGQVKIKMLPGYVREKANENARKQAMIEQQKRIAALGVDDATGLKRLYVPGTLDGEVFTLYGAKEIRRRRAANKVAKLARRRNR
jgi:hypothetical protein